MWRCIFILFLFTHTSVAMTFSSDQASFTKSFDPRGVIVSIQSRSDYSLLCHVRYLQDKVWLVLGAQSQSRPLLLPNAQYYDGSFACKPYQGNKEPGKMWRVQPYRYGIPAKNKLITVL